ncbi:MAG: GDSL-type esterase/lipase family protein [Acidobacteriota bacterium]
MSWVSQSIGRAQCSGVNAPYGRGSVIMRTGLRLLSRHHREGYFAHYARLLALLFACQLLGGQTRVSAAKPKGPEVQHKTTPKPVSSAKDFVHQALTIARKIPIENAASLAPFFESLYRRQTEELPGPTRILHYGDSHTAADFFTGELRLLLQAKFGNGGSGFSMPGKPWPSYRRADVRSGSSQGWRTSGLIGKKGDSIDGLSGISMTARTPRETLFIDADAASFELYYYRQPDGGSVQVLDKGKQVDTVSTAGPAGAGYYRTTLGGPVHRHRLELQTTDATPVRLFGWVAENPSGVTYEALGINGAQVGTLQHWDAEILSKNLEHRNPNLIVLWFGTNEAGNNLTQAQYEAQYLLTLQRLRAAAPDVPILILSPLDRAVRAGQVWKTMTSMTTVVEAQRNAARVAGCAFVDLRAKMGGAGSMLRWVEAGLAQPDRAHFNNAGYKALARVVFDNLMAEYDRYVAGR